MKSPIHSLWQCLPALVICFVLTPPPIRAADGTWTSLLSPRDWTFSGNWQSGTIADGSGSTAFFNTLDLSANITVALNGVNRTIGNLNFGNLTPSNNYSWTVSNNTLTLDGGTPTITVNDLGTGSATISSIIAGSLGVTKSGAGMLILIGNNTYTGGVTVSEGILRSMTNANAVRGNVAIASGATWQLGLSTSATLLTGLSGAGTVEAFGAGRILTVNNSTASTFSGVIQDGAGTLAITKVGAGDLTLSGPNTFTGALSLNEGKLIANASALGGAGTVSFNGGTLEVSASGTTARTLSFVGTGTIDTNGFDLTTGRIWNVSGGTFNKTGNGILTLAGANSNSSPATINVQAGTLRSGAANSLYHSAIHVSSGALLDFAGFANSDGSGLKLNIGLYGAGNVTTTVAGNMNITYGDFSGNLQQGNLQVGNGVNSGTLILSGTNDYDGTTTVTKGTLVVTGSTANSSNYSIAAAGKLQIGNATTTGSLSTEAVANAGTLELARSNALTFTNLISGAGTVLQSGAGTTTLGTANTYTGVTQITGGILSASVLANGTNNSSIGRGTTAATSLVLNGGTLQYTGGAVSSNRLFSVGTSGGTLDASGSGAVNFTGTGSMGFNAQTGTRTLTLTGSNLGNNTLAAVIGDDSGATSLVKNGAGKWVLSGLSTYTGGTTVNLGTLALSGANRLASTGAVVVAGGTLDLGAVAQSVGAVTLSSGTISNGTMTGTSYSATDSGTVSAVLAGSGAAFTKTGAGSVTLSAANTYTGTTLVSEGTLVLSGGGSIANSATVNVASGATLSTSGITFGTGQTLKGNGTITGNTILQGTLAAGNSPGLLTFSNSLELASSTNSIFEIGSGTPVRGTTYDGVNVGSLLTYNGTLTLDFTALSSGATYNLFDFTSVAGDFTSVVFAGGIYDGTFTQSAGFWTASDTNGSGQVFSFGLASGDLIVSAIPEPSTTLLLAGALTALAIFRRRRA